MHVATKIILLLSVTLCSAGVPIANPFSSTVDSFMCDIDKTNRTGCLAGQTCCRAAYSGSGYGCCTMPNAVCCPNRQTCCPEGTTCRDSGFYLTECIDNKNQVTSAGRSVCKPGPPDVGSSSLPICLILGDSVSIGYTPVVKELLKDVCNVLHTPWDVLDGGAEETAYGMQCLANFLRSSEGKNFPIDVVWFNFGLHNFDPDGPWVPGQSGSPDDYLIHLREIVDSLVHHQVPSLIYGLTTPVPYNKTLDDIVTGNLNTAAAELMKSHNIPVVDLHAAVTKVCGTVPYTCGISLNRNWRFLHNVHYNKKGYQYLGKIVADAIQSALSSKKGAKRHEATFS